MAETPRRRFALCIDDAGCDDLETRKVYEVLPDARAAAEGFLRVVDESGDDYLYPAANFVSIELPRIAERVLTPARGAAPAPARR